MRKADVVRSPAISSAIVPGTLYAQTPSVRLWITSFNEDGLLASLAGLEEQPSLAFRPANDDATTFLWNGNEN